MQFVDSHPSTNHLHHCCGRRAAVAVPFFFSAEQLIAGWVRNGRPEEEAPQQPLMCATRRAACPPPTHPDAAELGRPSCFGGRMDMRLLVQAMVTDASVRGKAARPTS